MHPVGRNRDRVSETLDAFPHWVQTEQMNSRKPVSQVAGLGTRFLTARRRSPRKPLPIFDRPLMQYAVNEGREAGIE